jgi:hypothetical protein
MPVGILNKTLIINGVSITTKELRNSLLDRNLPPPVSPGVEGLEGFQQQMGRVIFNLPNPNESIQLDIEKIENEENNNRDRLLNFNRYRDTSNVDTEYQVVNPTILSSERSEDNYATQNFGLIGLTNGIGVIQNPFTAIDSPRTDNFDSQLGNFGSERLEFLLNERVAQATLNETTNRINTDALSLIQGNELIQRNYDITIPSNIIAKGAELLGRLTGVELPVSTIPNGAIGWQEYNTAKANSSKLKKAVNSVLNAFGVNTQTNLSTEGRTNELLKRTGGGQKSALFRLLDLNQYVPSYENPRLFGLLGDGGTNSRYYIGDENNTNRGYGVTRIFKSEDFDNTGEGKVVRPPENFVWGGEEVPFPDQTILQKTNNLTEEFSETDVFIDQTKKFFKDKLTDKILSRGNAIQNNAGEYARVWLKSTDGTQRDQLEKGYSYNNAIRKRGLFTKDATKPGFSVDSGKASLSVLQSNGIVKSYPYLEESFTTYKKYMLSLENLAWSDNIADLPIQEIGPGDLISGRKGRIMWFAPYDLSFEETTTANWNTTEFLGRGEPLYTYNNTTRSGTFKFKILVDHPRIVNEWRGRQDNELEKFFAGITTPQEFLSFVERNTQFNTGTKKELEKKLNSIVRQSKNNIKETQKFNIYFPNDVTTNPPTDYETDLNGEYIDITNNGIDSKIGKFLSREDGDYTVEIRGYASKAGPPEGATEYNLNISKERITTAEALLKNLNKKIKVTSLPFGDTLANSNASDSEDNDQAIIDRRAEIVINYSSIDSETADKQEKLKELLQNDLEITNELFINETTYFDMIADDYPNYFDNISSKLTYFHPAFHSTTPEGLNSRLNFLQQCMRQGPSIYDKNDKGVKPDNLSFGRPPICILRIGDFIHTKVVIKSLTINYAAGNSIQWDLNPEGIGVQPMLADVNMSIEIIGGQSLQGPINRLQNAMSYNFYANTEMYDPRADSIELNEGKGKIVDGIRLGDIRGEDVSDELTDSLKVELPIDQEATRLKQEEVEQEALKSLGEVQINKDDNFNGYKYTISSISGETLTKPSQLVDKSGENRMVIKITDLIKNRELVNEEIDEPTKNYELYNLLKEDFEGGLDVMNELATQICETKSLSGSTPSNKKIKLKRLTNKLENQQEKFEDLRKDYELKVKIEVNFTKNENVRKTVEYSYKFSDVDCDGGNNKTFWEFQQ